MDPLYVSMMPSHDDTKSIWLFSFASALFTSVNTSAGFDLCTVWSSMRAFVLDMNSAAGTPFPETSPTDRAILSPSRIMKS